MASPGKPVRNSFPNGWPASTRPIRYTSKPRLAGQVPDDLVAAARGCFESLAIKNSDIAAVVDDPLAFAAGRAADFPVQSAPFLAAPLRIAGGLTHEEAV